MTVASPCISVCRMNSQSGLCEGCLRTLDEIAAWSTMDDEGKQDVWALIAQRAALHSSPLPEGGREPAGCAAS